MNAKRTISGVNVPTPCHENWNNMTPQSEGKFCGSCSKVVVDFTSMSPEEIKNYFLQKKEEKVCGHFNVAQLQEKGSSWLENILFGWFERAHRIRLATVRVAVLACIGFILVATGCSKPVPHKVGKVKVKYTEPIHMRGDVMVEPLDADTTAN